MPLRSLLKQNKLRGSLLYFFLIISSFPPFLERLFSVENHIQSSVFHWISWSLFLLFSLLLFLHWLSSSSFVQSLYNYLIPLAFSWATLLFIMAGDRVFGRIKNATTPSQESTCFYTPNSLMHYESFEMDFDIKTNEYGFRGKAPNPEQKDKIRIALIGDSFTLGWGLDIEESWAYLLEKSLQNTALEVEVLNWGKGGYQPSDYVKVAEEAIPIWKPDYVIVSIHQFEDLFQLAIEEDFVKNKYTQRGSTKLQKIAFNLFPNLYEYINAVPLGKQHDPRWDLYAEQVAQYWTASAHQNFEALPDSVQQYFNAGELNPWMLDMNLRYPNWTDSLFNKEIPMQKLAEAFNEKMGSIREIAHLHDATVLFHEIPFRGMISVEERQKLKAVGLDFKIHAATTFNEKWYALLHQQNLKLLKNTLCMQTYAKNSHQPLFINLDGHFTKQGNKAFEKCIQPDIFQVIK